MSTTARFGSTQWWQSMSREARAREASRQAFYQRVPAILIDYLRMSCGALVAFWLFATIALHVFGAERLTIYTAFGLLYALQSAYHQYRLARDPAYRIPKCGCRGPARNVDSEKVLRSAAAHLIPRIPNALLAAAFYALLLSQWHIHREVLVLIACVVSLYLAYVMVFRIRSLCTNCVNLGALNLLILLGTFA